MAADPGGPRRVDCHRGRSTWFARGVSNIAGARGGIFAPIAADDSAFRCVTVDYGTIVWPGDVDIAPETLIWDGPTPADEATRRPERFLRPQPPRY